MHLGKCSASIFKRRQALNTSLALADSKLHRLFADLSVTEDHTLRELCDVELMSDASTNC